MNRKPLIAGNWKMNLNHLEAISLTQKIGLSLTPEQLDNVEVAVLPPFTDIRSVQTLVDGEKLGVAYGAQDLSPHSHGAYTGDVSASMLTKLGCTYVLVGHSERREYHAEDDALVNAKLHTALKNGLTPILCVGEPLDVREEGRHIEYVVEQLRAALRRVKAEQIDGAVSSVVVAYEPVWAIGTGRVATPEDAQEVAAALRECVLSKNGEQSAHALRIVYGGSVKAGTIAGMVAQKDIDGALVGGASLSAEEFVAICRFPEH